MKEVPPGEALRLQKVMQRIQFDIARKHPFDVAPELHPVRDQSVEQIGEARQELKARAKRQRDRSVQLAAEVPVELRGPKATQKLGLWEDLSGVYHKSDKVAWECWRDGMDCIGECKVDESWEDRDKKDPFCLEIDEFERSKVIQDIMNGIHKKPAWSDRLIKATWDISLAECEIIPELGYALLEGPYEITDPKDIEFAFRRFPREQKLGKIRPIDPAIGANKCSRLRKRVPIPTPHDILVNASVAHDPTNAGKGVVQHNRRVIKRCRRAEKKYEKQLLEWFDGKREKLDEDLIKCGVTQPVRGAPVVFNSGCENLKRRKRVEESKSCELLEIVVVDVARCYKNIMVKVEHRKNGKVLKSVKRGMYKLNSDDYVDDFSTFVKRGLGKEVSEAMMELLEELGLPAMLEKVDYGLQLEILGLMFSVLEGEPVIFLTEQKKNSTKEVIDEACSAGVIDLDVLDKLIGRLTFVLSAVADRALSPVMRPLRRMLSKEERVVDTHVRTALVALREIIDLDIRRKVAFEDFRAPNIVLYTDASWEASSGWLGAVLAIDGKFYGVREKVTKGMLHDDYCVWAINYLETVVAVFAAKFYASKLQGKRFDHAIDNTCAQGWLLSQGTSSDKKKWYLAAASAQYWAEAAKHQFRPWIVRVPSHFNAADYPTREDLLMKMAYNVSSGNIIKAANPVAFGTISNDSDGGAAPVAHERAFLYFRIKNDESRRIYSGWLEILAEGSVASCPVLLGRPFMLEYGVCVCHDEDPQYAVIAGEKIEMSTDVDIAMVDIEFVQRADAVQGSGKSFLTEYLTRRAQISRVREEGENDEKYYTLSPAERGLVAKSFCAQSFRFTPEEDAALRAAVDADVKRAVNFASVGSDVEAASRSSSSLGGQGGPVSWGSDNAAGGGSVGGGSDGNNSPDEEETSEEEMSEQELEARLRLEFPDLSIGAIQWLKRQHKCLGHSAALEHLFKGRAKAAMKKVRKYCRKCMRQDDADQIRERGSLLQFATEKNKIWICDSMKSRLGKSVYITDGCTRLKVAELADADQGGLTGAAVRAVMLMRMVSQGTAEKILFDEGSEFNNALFVKVCHSVNMRTHPVGFKSAHRISKIERMNGDNRRNVRKLTMSPYDDHVAALLWSRASQPILIETLDAAVEEFLSTENNSDENPLDMQLKRELIAEHMAQLNSTPILGQSLTPYNLASGGYYSAARDWEQLREDLAEGEEFGDDMERWFRLKCRIQAATRKVIRQYDAEQLLRRREIVGRSYKRVLDLSRLEPGMRVYIRRGDGKFRRHEDGVVTSVADDGAYVKMGKSTVKYPPSDIALITDDSTGTALEHYPDEEFSDELERRLTVYDDEEPFFADPMTSVQGGRSTASTKSSGGSGMGHNCHLCDKQCTSRARLVQHMAEKHGIPEEEIQEQPQVPAVFRRGSRRLIDFDDSDDEDDDFNDNQEPLAPPAVDVAFDEQGNPVDRWTETAEAVVRWHVLPRRELFTPSPQMFPHADVYSKLTGERKTIGLLLDNPLVEETATDNWKRPGSRASQTSMFADTRLWVGRTEFRKMPSMFLREFLLKPRDSSSSSDNEEDVWQEDDKTVTVIHNRPRRRRCPPTNADITHEVATTMLEPRRTTTQIYVDDLNQQQDEEDDWKRDSSASSSSDPRSKREWIGRAVFYKKKDAWGKRVLPFTQKSKTAGSAVMSGIEEESKEADRESRHSWQQEYERISRESEEEIDKVLGDGGTAASSIMRPTRTTTQPTRSGPYTRAASSYMTCVPAPENKPADGRIYLGKGGRIFTDGTLHSSIASELQDCMSTMELKLEDGKLYLAPAENDVSGSVVRAYDFTVIPTVAALLEGKDRHEGRLRQSDECCYLFSQLLNGRPIKELLNGKDSRDVQYVVTGVELQRNKKHVSSQPMKGNSVFLRWGDNLSPEFVSEDSSTWAPASNFWTARIFFETTTSAHEAMQAYTKGTKSSAMQIELKTAEQFGFESYFIPSVREEVKAIISRDVFGRNAKRSEISDRNVMTSRLVVTIKIDLGTGKVSKIKSRWVSRGFEDRRFSSKKNENSLNCRSHTMSDASYLLLLQFCQATRSATWNADIKEAFLEGMTFQEAHAGNEDYWANPNSTLWMTIPKVIQDMQEFGFGEVVELVKCIYGCKDAPYNWMLTFHTVPQTIGLKQSLLDPCLWLCFATPQEEEVLKGGYDAVKAYFYKQVEAIDLLDKQDTEGMASVLLGMKHDKLPEYKPSSSPDFINPDTERLAQALTMRVQFKGTLVGAIGSHVDDTKSGGHLLFMLRLYALFRRFPLGSFCRLDPGRRDAFIGREEQCVPEVVDKFQMQQMLEAKKQEIAENKIEIPDEFLAAVDEQELQEAEKQYNIDRATKPHAYAKVDSIQVSAKVLEEGCRMQEEVVYVVGQENYATKVKPIEKEEVLEYFRQRDLAKTKLQKKQVENPFRGRIGELIWSLKANSCIAATVSDLAGQLIPAEKADSWEQVMFYVNDLSGIIMMLQHSEASSRRVARLGGLFEHYMMGCGDASKSRVGGTLNLIGLLKSRFTTLNSFSRIPHRVHSSSTGIETLAGRMVCSELLYLTQLALDLHLVRHGSTILQLVDSKNMVSEPREKNLALDFFALSQLRDEGILAMKHIPGRINWSDALTKSIREVVLILLYLASVWGICEKAAETVIREFMQKQERERARKERTIEEEGESQEETRLIADDDEEDEAALPQNTSSSSAVVMKTTGGPLAAGKKTDSWVETEETLTRVHGLPRLARHTPCNVDSITAETAQKYLQDNRTTNYTFVDTPHLQLKEEDSWRDRSREHAVIAGRRKWTGTTTFEKVPDSPRLLKKKSVKKSKNAKKETPRLSVAGATATSTAGSSTRGCGELGAGWWIGT
eukprot:g16474.t1